MNNLQKAYSLKGKTAIVTGGNRGVGYGCAQALAQAGANICIIARNEESIKKAVIDLETNTGVKVIGLTGDVTDVKSVQKAINNAINKFGKLDILVNNSGICRNENAEDMLWNDWYDVINVNLNGVFIVSQIVGREMIKQKTGSIINISSMSADIVNYPQPQCSYNAAKAAVNQLTKSLAYEWSKYNIRVNAIAPGYILTDLSKPGIDCGFYDVWTEATPMKRAGDPFEVGCLAVYLASEASTFTTGSIHTIDGGYTLI